jgi:hypothetical protein
MLDFRILYDYSIEMESLQDLWNYYIGSLLWSKDKMLFRIENPYKVLGV